MSRDDQKNFRYTPSWCTDVMSTLKKHGFRKMTVNERAKKLKRCSARPTSSAFRATSPAAQWRR
jgi:hypothetical protein